MAGFLAQRQTLKTLKDQGFLVGVYSPREMTLTFTLFRGVPGPGVRWEPIQSSLPLLIRAVRGILPTGCTYMHAVMCVCTKH
jgi:hypothetical protein